MTVSAAALSALMRSVNDGLVSIGISVLLACKLDQPVAAAGSSYSIAAAHKARSSQAGDPMRRGALPQKAKGALTTRCAVADETEKRRRQRVPSSGTVQKPACAGYHCAAFGGDCNLLTLLCQASPRSRCRSLASSGERRGEGEGHISLVG
jgi:hypothetical protein